MNFEQYARGIAAHYNELNALRIIAWNAGQWERYNAVTFIMNATISALRDHPTMRACFEEHRDD